MTAGLMTLSFNLFGLNRKAGNETSNRDKEPKLPLKGDNSEQNERDKDQEHELFFWSLYPVI